MKLPMPQEIWIYNNEPTRSYIITFIGEAKIADNQWVKSVSYQCTIDGRFYTRDIDTFLKKFNFMRGIAE